METTAVKLSEMFRAYMPEHTIVRNDANRIIVSDAVVGREIVYDPVRKIMMNTGVREDIIITIQTLARASM